MDNQNHSATGTWLTVGLFIIGRLTLSEWALVATILAGLSTMALNAFRIYNENKKKKWDNKWDK